jgi:hypothetical protein
LIWPSISRPRAPGNHPQRNAAPRDTFEEIPPPQPWPRPPMLRSRCRPNPRRCSRCRRHLGRRSRCCPCPCPRCRKPCCRLCSRLNSLYGSGADTATPSQPAPHPSTSLQPSPRAPTPSHPLAVVADAHYDAAVACSERGPGRSSRRVRRRRRLRRRQPVRLPRVGRCLPAACAPASRSLRRRELPDLTPPLSRTTIGSAAGSTTSTTSCTQRVQASFRATDP